MLIRCAQKKCLASVEKSDNLTLKGWLRAIDRETKEEIWCCPDCISKIYPNLLTNILSKDI